MHTEPTIVAGKFDDGPSPSLNVDPAKCAEPPSNTSAQPEWLGTPMEMVADAFGMDSPWRRADRNHKAHMRNVQARRNKRNKAAKKARRRNRR